MHHPLRLLVLSACLLALGLSATQAHSQTPPQSNRTSAQSRLVVFETFMRPG
jgi:hypothetical protein